MTTRPRIAWLGVEPAPYFLPLLNRLDAGDELDIHFFFCLARRTQPWNFEGEDLLGRPIQDRVRAAITKPVHGREIVSRFLRERWDGAVICGYNTLVNRLAIIACLLRGIPFLLQGDTQGLLPCSPFKHTIRKLALSPIMRRCGGGLGVGKLSMKFWEGLGIPKSRVVHMPCASHLEHFMQRRAGALELRPEIRSALAIASDQLVGLFVGRLVDFKGVDLLLDGLRLLSPESRPTLLIVGDGPERANLESKATQLPVKFLGFRESRELPPMFAAADFFLMPSRIEPWGIVLGEAMAGGLPVVASDQVGAAYDLLTDNQNGFLVSDNTARGWAAAIQKCIDAAPRLTQMGEQSSQAVSGWTCDYAASGVLAGLELCTGRDLRTKRESDAKLATSSPRRSRTPEFDTAGS